MKGSYRRAKGGVGLLLPEVVDDPDIAEGVLPAQKMTKRKGQGRASKKGPGQPAPIAEANPESGEFFDLGAISSGSEDDEVPQATIKRSGRPPKAALSPARITTEDVLASNPEPLLHGNVPPRKARGRPRKLLPHSTPAVDDVPMRLPPTPLPIRAASDRPKTKTAEKRSYCTTAAAVPSAQYSGEFFDLNIISAGSDDSDDGVPPAPTIMSMQTKMPFPQAVHAGRSGLSAPSKQSSLATAMRHVPNSGLTSLSRIAPSSRLVSRSEANGIQDIPYRAGLADPFEGPSDRHDANTRKASNEDTLAVAFSGLAVSRNLKSTVQQAVIIELSD